MTIQIGLRGTDGLVLAGDRMWHSDPGRIWRRWFASKMNPSEDGRTLIACARNMNVAQSAAIRILSEITGCDAGLRGKRLLDIGENVAIESHNPEQNNKFDAECLVAFSDTCSFSLLRISGDGKANCYQGLNPTTAGDATNPSLFWYERYYDRSLTVEQLVPLAARVVVDAGKMSNGNIGGLEIATCRQGEKFHVWSDQENKELELWVEQSALDIGRFVVDRANRAIITP